MRRVQKIFLNVHWSVLFCGSTFCARAAGFCVVSTLLLQLWISTHYAHNDQKYLFLFSDPKNRDS